VWSLKAKAWGESMDKINLTGIEVKAATYGALKLKKEKDKYEIRCILDV